MSRIAPINYDKVIKALSAIGYKLHHQHGSHIVMHLSDKEKYISFFGERNPEYMVVVPAHRPIGRGMVRTIMKEVDLSVDEFNNLLHL